MEKQEDREQFEAQLLEPIPGMSSSNSTAMRDAEMAQFMSAKGVVG